MAIGCFAGFVLDDKMVLTVLSLAIAVILLIATRKTRLSTKTKIGLIYGHLIFLSFPLVLFTTNFACGTMCMSCYTDAGALFSYALPSAVAVGTIAGLVVIPAFYTFSAKRRSSDREIAKFIRKYSRVLGISAPKLYVVDKAKPVAFSFRSFRSAVFVSVGMMDILSKRELQAVLLHELAHIKQKSSLLKFSSLIMRLSPLSVLARFHHDTGKEEHDADNFAIQAQGTSKYVRSAKRKVNNYN